jgi:F-type H+-transporting ATPase subunit epsilon
MINEFSLVVISPIGEIYKNSALQFLRLPGKSGHIGVLPGHSSTVAHLTAGEVQVQEIGDDQVDIHSFFISESLAYITPNSVTIFADYFESSDKIDPKRAQSALNRAQERLASKSNEFNMERAYRSKNRAKARLQIKSI